MKRRNLVFLLLIIYDKSKIFCIRTTRNIVTHMLQNFLQQKPLDESFPQSNHHTRQFYWLYMDAATEHFETAFNISILKLTKWKVTISTFLSASTHDMAKRFWKKKSVRDIQKSPLLILNIYLQIGNHLCFVWKRDMPKAISKARIPVVTVFCSAFNKEKLKKTI